MLSFTLFFLPILSALVWQKQSFCHAITLLLHSKSNAFTNGGLNHRKTKGL